MPDPKVNSAANAVLRLGLLAVLSCTALLCACREEPPRQSSSTVTLAGDKLYLPADCRIERFRAAEGVPKIEFSKFDGSYPGSWPAGFELPQDYYLRSSPLKPEDAANPDAPPGLVTIQFGGVAKLGFAETIEYFRSQGQQAGFTVAGDRFIDTDQTISESGMQSQEALDYARLAMGPGLHDLLLEKPGSPSPIILIKVLADQDMDGYTYLMGHVTVDTGAAPAS